MPAGVREGRGVPQRRQRGAGTAGVLHNVGLYFLTKQTGLSCEAGSAACLLNSDSGACRTKRKGLCAAPWPMSPCPSPQAFRAPAGTTELPTCPVCLERLDEHISGIVTTVRQGPSQLSQSVKALVSGWLTVRGAGWRERCSALAAPPRPRLTPTPLYLPVLRCATTASTTSACGSGATPPAPSAATASTRGRPPPRTATSATPPQVGGAGWWPVGD